MKLYDEVISSSTSTKLAIAAVVAAWGLLFFILFSWAFTSFEQRGRALEATPVARTPAIFLEPTTGSVGTAVTVQGEGWPANNLIIISLLASADTNPPDYAVANTVTDAEGRFTAHFIFPQESRWDNQTTSMVVARTAEAGLMAGATFNLAQSVTLPAPTATSLPLFETSPTSLPATSAPILETVPLLPINTPTPLPLPTATNTPAFPLAIAGTNLNIRSGPGTGYPVIGLLLSGQSVEVTGLSYDRGWWQIRLSGVAAGYGWLSARYVTAQNVNNIPLVQAPAPPIQPTPAPVPVVSAPLPVSNVGVWRAEYYTNPYLSGTPVLIRNDADINFNWGTASPASGGPADNFSVRWTGIWAFNEGTYRFSAIVDDGVRLYVDEALVIDSWRDGAQRELAGDRWLPSGYHTIRVEYYEHLDQALIRVWTSQIVPPPTSHDDDDDDDDDEGIEANFSVNRRSGPAPLRVEFDNDSTGDYDDCEWDFGDGADSDDCDDVSHTYHEPGTYTVWLWIDGPDGSDVKRKKDYIKVEQASPPQPPYVPADWHDLLPPDWRSQVPEQYHNAIEACLDHFNQISRPVESPPDLNSILKDCTDFLE